jgi:hypothetical protein
MKYRSIGTVLTPNVFCVNQNDKKKMEEKQSS